jgi:hypothetical protein
VRVELHAKVGQVHGQETASVDGAKEEVFGVKWFAFFPSDEAGVFKDALFVRAFIDHCVLASRYASVPLLVRRTIGSPHLLHGVENELDQFGYGSFLNLMIYEFAVGDFGLVHGGRVFVSVRKAR